MNRTWTSVSFRKTVVPPGLHRLDSALQNHYSLTDPAEIEARTQAIKAEALLRVAAAQNATPVKASPRAGEHSTSSAEPGESGTVITTRVSGLAAVVAGIALLAWASPWAAMIAGPAVVPIIFVFVVTRYLTPTRRESLSVRFWWDGRRMERGAGGRATRRAR